MLFYVHAGDYSAYDEEESCYVVVAPSSKEAKQIVFKSRKKASEELLGPYSEFTDRIEDYDVTELTQTPGVKLITNYVSAVPGAIDFERK